MRDIGRMGENFFEYNCNSVGLVANGSKIDKTGWDFFVEFPLDGNSIRHLDQIKTPLSCRVQVKATDKTDKKLSIKMSNLLTLAKSHTPSFIYFIEFDKTDAPKKTYLVHFDSTLIDDILQKARNLSVKECNPKLHKKTMTIHYDKDHHKLQDTSGESLKLGIINSIGGDYDKYVTNKIKHLQETGYENGAASITFKLSSEDDLQNLIESTLGGKQKINVNEFSVTETRFGIKSPTPIVSHESGTISFGDIPPLSDGEISFHENKFSSPLTFKCKIYNSPFNFCVPKEKIQLKIEGDFFTITVGLYSGKAKYNFSFNSILMPLSKFSDAFRLMEIICSGNKTIRASTKFKKAPGISLNIKCNNDAANWKSNLSVINDILFIADEFKIPKDTVTTLDYIIEKHNDIKELVKLMQANEKDINISFVLEPYNEKINNSLIFALYTFETFILDRWIIYIVGLDGTAYKTANNRMQLTVNKKQTQKMLSLLERLNTEDYNELMEEICQLHNDKTIIIL